VTGGPPDLSHRDDLTQAERDEIAFWDWPAIRSMEVAARRRHASALPCRVCGGPLICGQLGTHLTCLRVAL
jgi:hypothetical protein